MMHLILEGVVNVISNVCLCCICRKNIITNWLRESIKSENTWMKEEKVEGMVGYKNEIEILKIEIVWKWLICGLTNEWMC